MSEYVGECQKMTEEVVELSGDYRAIVGQMSEYVGD
jgi:hypothetical protein